MTLLAYKLYGVSMIIGEKIMKVFYCRCSTEHQQIDRQLEEAKNVGAEKIFTEMISGKDTNRPQLKQMMDFVREGDVVYVVSYDRLARSANDLISIVNILNDKKVNFVSLKENIDTSTPQGKLVFHLFAGLAEFERTNMLDRQRIGIEIAKKKGKYKGRKPIRIPNNYNEVIGLWKKGDITAKRAMEMLNMKPSTFYRKVKTISV